MISTKSGLAFLLAFSVLSFGCAPGLSAAESGPGSTENSTGDGGNKGVFDLKAQTDLYRQRYNLKNPYDKLVDNRGNGYEDLYGIRNLRVVLHGIYYRGGANNTYNKYLKRGNSNPLQDHALDNLCKEGFTESIYLYSTNYSSARKNTSCRNFHNEDQNLDYPQINAFSTSKEQIFLGKIFDRIRGKTRGLLYAHCWNGWHASGLIAALSLQQFCGWSGTEAEQYWIRNTDGDSNYPDHKKRIREFKPDDKFKITPEEQALICP
ncbi:MAG: hypothetical protein KF681_09035 [Bdellovibrionaceae bacterium]|nr:hypothetical protein [Pseudobdellovibrionaceae bacterium]